MNTTSAKPESVLFVVAFVATNTSSSSGAKSSPTMQRVAFRDAETAQRYLASIASWRSPTLERVVR